MTTVNVGKTSLIFSKLVLIRRPINHSPMIINQIGGHVFLIPNVGLPFEPASRLTVKLGEKWMSNSLTERNVTYGQLPAAYNMKASILI